MASSSQRVAIAASAPEGAEAGDVVLYRNERTRVFRRQLPDGAVVFKQALGSEAVGRLRHERAVLERLADVDGVAKIAAVEQPVDTLALRDEGGVPLSQVLRTESLSLAAQLELALQLARIVAAMHRHGVVHKDLNPANIVVVGSERRPLIIDFNIASVFAEDRPSFTHQSDIAGTVAYMAPEQTGRTGRTVDQRADLYALGVTLYEMTVGQRPFLGEDLLQLIHDHLVRTPTPPLDANAQLPPVLSDIIMRLLEKESDRRYQSAEGLAEDLLRLQQSLARGDLSRFALGEHDFPLRLSSPSRLIGRDAEIKVLRDTLDKAVQGRCRALFVTGAAGVGKNALVDELRPMVTERRGWFVSGKFDQYSKDAPSATVQALRALGRMLLAEPEAELARHRERIVKAHGPNLGIGPSGLPEFALLLGNPPRLEVGDPVEAEARMLQACIDVLRCIASPERPLVMVLDDLHKAAEITARFINALLTATQELPGFLLVCTYRDREVGDAHPLTAKLAQWDKLGVAPVRLPVAGLSPADLAALVGEMLRLPPPQAASLSGVLGARTDGNPNDTVELINALRLDGLLAPRDGGWSWDASAIHRYVGKCEVIDLLARRIERLPKATRELLEVLACLSGDINLELLAQASGVDAVEVERRLAPALDDGLLAMDQSRSGVLQFRQDRVQQAVIDRLDPVTAPQLHLAIARRIVATPGAAANAAEQYFAALDQLNDPEECREVVELFKLAAYAARVVNNAAAERFLAAAISLLDRGATPADAPLLIALETERHFALYGLARFDEADALYQVIVQHCTEPMQQVEAACVQLSSLCNRNRMQEAADLGIALLAQFGIKPPADLQAAIGSGLGRLARWIAGEEKADDLHREETNDPVTLALAKLIKRVQTALFFCNPPLHAWLTLESHQMWVEAGPCTTLAACLCTLPLLLMGILRNYRGAYVAARHMLAVGEARGYEPATAMIRFNFAISAQHWFEPIEDVAPQLHRAREVLSKAGDLQYTSFTYNVETPMLLDCAPTLEGPAAGIDATLAYTARIGDQYSAAFTLMYRQFVRALRAETTAPGGFSDASFDAAAYEAKICASESTASALYHVVRSIAAALFKDMPTLAHHSALALAQQSRLPGFYYAGVAQVLNTIVLAEQARSLPANEQAELLAKIDATREWLAQRAADAPANFKHLSLLLDAERAWAAGDALRAARAFDKALQEVESGARPWQRGFITERAGLFNLAHGFAHTARQLLIEARAVYDAWGAKAKVREMMREHAFLRRSTADGGGTQQTEDGFRSTILSPYVVDMLAVLRASQALSSETSLERLNARVVELLGTMTGATAVHLAVRRDDPAGWVLSSTFDDNGAPVSVDEAAARGLLPLSVFSYVERIHEQLVVADATRDDRFLRDPCLAGVEQCSLLCVPILSKGELRAVLLLENRMTRGAFSSDRLDSVALIAGQLAVSLDNALLYASLERKVAERTLALEEANRRLEQLSITDALTGLANRRRFNEALAAEWVRARRAGEPVGLALIDIDHFKLYNDHYGHQGGDSCLRAVAATMRDALRSSTDLVARYGGEEFVLLLPATDTTGTVTVAERVRAAVEALKAPHVKSGHGIVTVSIGVIAFVPTQDTTAEQLIEQADAALYEAKRSGRNRVMVGGAGLSISD